MGFPIVNTRSRVLPGGAAELILEGGRTVAGGVQRHRDQQRAERLAGEERDFDQLQRTKDRAHQLAMTNVAHMNALERSRLDTEARSGQAMELARFNRATQQQALESRLGLERELREEELGFRREELDRRHPEDGGDRAISELDVLKLVTGGEPFDEEYHGEQFDRVMTLVTGQPPRRLAMHPDDWELISGQRGPSRGSAAPPDRRTPPPANRADALEAGAGAAGRGGAGAGAAGGIPAGVEGLDPAEIAEDLIRLVPAERLEAEIAKLPPELQEQVRREVKTRQVRRGTESLPDSLRMR